MTTKLIYGFIALHLCLIAVTAFGGLLPNTEGSCTVGPAANRWTLNGATCGSVLASLADAVANLFNFDGGFLEAFKTKFIGGIGIVRTLFEMAIMDYDLLKQEGTVMGFLGLGVRFVGWGLVGSAFVSALGSFRSS